MILPAEDLRIFTEEYINISSNLYPSFISTLIPTFKLLYGKVNRPTKPLTSPSPLSNNLFFYVIYYPRDIFRLIIRKIYDVHYKEVFYEELRLEKFIICYYHDKNLKEYLSLSTFKALSMNENISRYFKKLKEMSEN